jgi:hypothetical protein
MKTYRATRDLPPTIIKKGDVFNEDTYRDPYDLNTALLAIMLATGLIEEVPEKKEWRAEDLKVGDSYLLEVLNIK